MRFTETPLAGAFVIELERHDDERGYFARTFCRDEMVRHGLEPDVAQSSISFNARRGTLRGMHYQSEPHAEAKLVRCIAGAIHDVIVDLRPGSPTLHRSFAIELDATSLAALYVPRGFAHGFLTLTDGASVLYQMSTSYEPSAARGLRWDDPALGIAWPFAPVVIGARDAGYAPLASSGAR